MKNVRNLYILGAMLIAVVAIIIIIEVIGKQKSSPKALQFFPEFTPQTCSAFQIADNKDTVKVFRTGDVWMVSKVTGKATAEAGAEKKEGLLAQVDSLNPEQKKEQPETEINYPVDSASLASALEKLDSMKKDILVSQNPEKQETFEVDSAHGVVVEVWGKDGNSLGTFRIGKNTPSYSSHYVRMIGSNDVWAVSGSIKYAFFSDLKRWRDKSIVKFDAAQVKTMTIASLDTATKQMNTLKFEKATDSLSNAVWSIAEPEKAPAKKDEIDRLVQGFATLKTTDWDNAATDSAKGFDNPRYIISVALENSETQRIVVGNKQGTSGKVYVRADGKDDTFVVYESALTAFNKKLDDLKMPPPPPPEPTKAETGKDTAQQG